ncbi:hypothetical protein [Nocardioides yefusunii]|uniref:Uncharacterized protein n=1 Tax=Nocardioides yefusunii TaxID=2500546 RepID=A0ABW1QWJ2_9ACTN|nr:hypothetical protein [Nocardioides yefusunii]
MTDVRPHLIDVLIDDEEAGAELARFEFHSVPSADEFVTFATARQGGERDWSVQMTVKETGTAGTAYQLALNSPGTKVEVVYRPHGNATATPAEPHYTQMATVQPIEGRTMGGTATRSRNARSSMELVWPLDGAPVKVTA